MADEKKYASDYGFPEVTAGVYILNKKGEIFLIRSPKWNNKLIPCGGHVEFNEKITEAVVREAKEETGFDVVNPELITVIDMAVPKETYGTNRHFVGLQYTAELADDAQVYRLDNNEAIEGVWLKPEDIIKRDDAHEGTKEIVTNYLLKPKKSFFGTKKCKDCEKAKEQMEEYKIGWQRALADYQNLKKETAARRTEWAQMSEQEILEEFIPVYDNFKKAFVHHPELLESDEIHKQVKNWTAGIGYIMKQFGDVLKTHNIEEIKTVGEKFDHNLHEAMGEEETEGKESGVILREVEGGYKMNSKIIKPAKVIVTK